MQTRTALFVPTLFLIACTTESSAPVELPPHGGVQTVHETPPGVTPFSTSAFVFTGPTAPGSATFVNAPVAPDEPPMPYGSGTLAVTVSGQAYNSSALETVGIVTSDGTQDYLVLGGYQFHTVAGIEHVSQAFVVVRRSDFAVGATVAFDGQDRFAMFGEGPATAEDPTLVAAAVTGSVTFTAGSLAANGTGTITATVNGDFGEIDYVSTPAPGGGSITAGMYTLDITGPASVYCDGTLAGQEAAFASVTSASLGFTNGAVTISTSPGTSVTGAPIASAFGAPSLALEDSGDDLLAGFSSLSAAGPAGTTHAGNYLVVDPNSSTSTFVNGGVGAGYVTNTGSCSVSFGASLTAL